MTELLVTIIISVCAGPSGDVDFECADKINNCAVELKTLVTKESINKCLEEHYEEKKQFTNK